MTNSLIYLDELEEILKEKEKIFREVTQLSHELEDKPISA